MQVRAAAFVEIDDDLETIEQDVLLDRLGEPSTALLAFVFRSLAVSVSSEGVSASTGGDTHW